MAPTNTTDTDTTQTTLLLAATRAAVDRAREVAHTLDQLADYLEAVSNQCASASKAKEERR